MRSKQIVRAGGKGAFLKGKVFHGVSKGGKGLHKLAFSKKTSPAAAGVTQAVAKKKHRFKPGTVALREIRKYQKGTEILMARAPFVRMMRTVVKQINDRRKCGVTRLTQSAIEAYMEGAQSFMVDMFERSHNLAIHAQRVTLLKKDMCFAVGNSKGLEAGSGTDGLPAALLV